MTKIIIGMGDLGESKYSRHSVGFLAVDKMLQELNDMFADKNEWVQAENYKFVKPGDTMLVKPDTLVNFTGEIFNHIQIEKPSDVLVIYDDIYTKFGSVKVRNNGSAGGHNGIKSIISKIGEDFDRIKIGIGMPPEGLGEHVMGDFLEEEQVVLNGSLLEEVGDLAWLISVHGVGHTRKLLNETKLKGTFKCL